MNFVSVTFINEFIVRSISILFSTILTNVHRYAHIFVYRKYQYSLRKVKEPRMKLKTMCKKSGLNK